MNKFLISMALVLAAFVGTASAQTSVSGSYDAGLLNNSNTVLTEYRADLTQTVGNFAFSVGGIGLTNNTVEQNGSALEASVGYTLPTVLTVETTVTAGVGHRFFNGATGYYYYVGQVNARKWLTDNVAVVAGYRYRDGMKIADPIRDSRGQVGLQFNMGEKLSTSVLYTHTQYANNVIANGALVNVAVAL